MKCIKFLLALCSICCIIPTVMFAQVDTAWVRRYNGPVNNADRARSLVYDPDGNIYIAGDSYGSGTSWDFTVISITSTGSERWVYRYNGPGNGSDWAKPLICGADGNIYIAGTSTGSGTDYDFTVISLTSGGTQRWVYRYNGPGNSMDYANSLVYGADGNIYAAGASTDGGTWWSDFTVISLTSTGTQRWVYQYNGPANASDVAHSLVYGADGNIYAAGYSVGSGYTDFDFTAISLTSSGNQRWVYQYNNYYDCAYSLVYGSDGNIYIAGYAGYDFTVISLTSTGTQRWMYQYDGPGNGGDEASSLVYGADGNIYIAGTSTGSGTDFDFTVISLTSTGTQRWVYRYNGPGNYWDEANSLVYGSDGNIYIAGYSAGIGTYSDFTVISLNPAIGIEENREPLSASRSSLEVYPNPAKTYFTIHLPSALLGEISPLRGGQTVDRSQIKMFDITGKLVKELESPGVGELIISLDGIKNGVYFLTLQTEEKRIIERVVIVK